MYFLTETMTRIFLLKLSWTLLLPKVTKVCDRIKFLSHFVYYIFCRMTSKQLSMKPCSSVHNKLDFTYHDRLVFSQGDSLQWTSFGNEAHIQTSDETFHRSKYRGKWTYHVLQWVYSLYKNQIRLTTEYCCHICIGAAQFSLACRDRIQMCLRRPMVNE